MSNIFLSKFIYLWYRLKLLIGCIIFYSTKLCSELILNEIAISQAMKFSPIKINIIHYNIDSFNNRNGKIVKHSVTRLCLTFLAAFDSTRNVVVHLLVVHIKHNRLRRHQDSNLVINLTIVFVNSPHIVFGKQSTYIFVNSMQSLN